MNWSVLVRIPETEAAAEAFGIQRSVLMTGGICLLLLAPIAWFVGRKGDQQVEAIKESEMKLEAAGKAQAVIEFDNKGNILTANENFLNTVGYSLSEIQGQHHRIFCDPAYASSREYSAFWEKLNRGEFDAGVYRRLGKGGKEAWIQASYNPIKDTKGSVYKVVKFATDITAQKNAQAQLEGMMAEAQKVLGAMAQGDLREKMTGAYEGDLDNMKQSINAAIDNLTKTVTTVLEGAANVQNAAGEISQGNDDLSQRTSEQASSLEETSASMEQMTSTVKQNADNAKQANQLAIAAREVAEKGGSVTSSAVQAMEEINKSSKKIADIINVIDEIAFQTNLLALNAAVEAARAGEQGRGFAVVATEVRNLAQRSASAAKEIKDLINESVQKVGDGSELVNQSGKTLEEIVGSVKRVTDIIAEISAASQEQSAGIDQVNKAIMQMDQTTQQNAALVEQAASSAQSMQQQAGALQREVEFFKTSVVRTSSSSQAPNSVANAGTAKPKKQPVQTPSGSAEKESFELVGAGAGKGQDGGDDTFEEF